jgi:hypothetical protein
MGNIEKALQSVDGEFIITTHNEGPDVREFYLNGSLYVDAVAYLYDTNEDIQADLDKHALCLSLDDTRRAVNAYLEENHDLMEERIAYAIAQFDYLSD